MDSPSVTQPASGTYGESADLERLKASLPAGSVGGPAAPAPKAPPISTEPVTQPQPTPGGRPPGSPPPPGLPSVLAAPTDRPEVPVSTPLAMPQMGTPAIADPRQARLAILDALVTNPGVSPETREWAQTVIHVLLGT